MQSNRQQLFATIAEQLTRAQADSLWLGLILIDIRGFSNINRAYGFACGDALIEQVNQQLVKTSKNPSLCFHIGNDEFALLVPNINAPSLISIAASQVADQLRTSFIWNDQQIALQVNIGATATDHPSSNADAQQSIEALVFTAEHALSHAKQLNLAFHIEDVKQQTHVATDLSLHTDFKNALFENKLELHYQPQVHFEQQASVCAEALLRWQHPTRGLIPPSQLLPICSQLGLNLDLTKWVINTALRHIHEWPEQSVANISINISADIIDTFALPELVKNSLKVWGVNPSQLTVEITESAVFNDKNTGFSNLSQLHDIGVNISIDDFGTGYSSLEYFKHIPANEIKIDRSFVSNMHNDEADRKLVKLIIDLAHSFDMHVVAEGVENQNIADLLKSMGCNFAQGYFYSPALPYPEFVQWCKR
jgi:diguanylate cyclase (GGDEF)-like protein